MRTVLFVIAVLLAIPCVTAQTPNRVIQLDGANDYAYAVIIGGFNPNEISVEAWIRPEAPMAGSALRETRVVSKGTENFGPLLDGRFSLTYTEDGTPGAVSGTATFRVYLGSFIPNDQAVVSSPMPVSPDQWTHLAGTFSNVSGQVSLYVNGSIVASSMTSMMGAPLTGMTMTSSPQPLAIGGVFTNLAATAFRGQIDEVRVWNVERNANQIAMNFLNALSSGTGLVDAWHFDGDALSIFNPPPPSAPPPVQGSPTYPISFVPGFGGGAFPWQQECQLNQPEASLSGPGPLGDTSGPTVVSALIGTITADSTLMQQPWDLVLTAPELPVAQASGGFGLQGGQIVNVSLTAPSLTFLTNFLVPFTGTVAFPFNLPSGLPPITAQLVVGDPASPSGVRLSAPLVLAPGF